MLLRTACGGRLSGAIIREEMEKWSCHLLQFAAWPDQARVRRGVEFEWCAVGKRMACFCEQQRTRRVMKYSEIMRARVHWRGICHASHDIQSVAWLFLDVGSRSTCPLRLAMPVSAIMHACTKPPCCNCCCQPWLEQPSPISAEGLSQRGAGLHSATHIPGEFDQPQP